MAALMFVGMMVIIMAMLVGMLLFSMFMIVSIMGMRHLHMLMLVFMLLVGMATHFVFTSFLINFKISKKIPHNKSDFKTNFSFPDPKWNFLGWCHPCLFFRRFGRFFFL